MEIPGSRGVWNPLRGPGQHSLLVTFFEISLLVALVLTLA